MNCGTDWFVLKLTFVLFVWISVKFVVCLIVALAFVAITNAASEYIIVLEKWFLLKKKFGAFVQSIIYHYSNYVLVRGDCPLSSQHSTCSPKCLQDHECASRSEICCPNLCNAKSCVRPKAGTNSGGSSSSSNGYKGSSCEWYDMTFVCMRCLNNYSWTFFLFIIFAHSIIGHWYLL